MRLIIHALMAKHKTKLSQSCTEPKVMKWDAIIRELPVKTQATLAQGGK